MKQNRKRKIAKTLLEREKPCASAPIIITN